jgi:hypothetical protein
MTKQRRWLGTPSPAMIVAILALMVGLTGSAVAAGVVPLARRALVADNAKKFGGQTPRKALIRAVEVALLVGPLSIKHLVVVRSAAWSVPAGSQADFAASCDAGQKVVSGGFDAAAGQATPVASRPGSDGASWRVFLANASTTAAASGSVYAVCVK